MNLNIVAGLSGAEILDTVKNSRIKSEPIINNMAGIKREAEVIVYFNKKPKIAEGSEESIRTSRGPFQEQLKEVESAGLELGGE